MKRQLLILLAGLLLISATSVSAANLKGAYSVTPLIGGYSYDGKQHLDTNLVYGLRAGYNLTKSIGVEALFDYVHNTDSTIGRFKGLSMQRYGGEALYHFFPDDAFVPYVAAGYAGLNFDGDAKKKTVGAFDYGIGAKYFFNDRFALRGDVRHVMYSYDRTYHNLEYTLGAHIPFGGISPIAKTVEPVEQKMSAQPPLAVPNITAAVEAPLTPGARISVNPATIAKGQAASLSWDSSNATDCTIQPAIGVVQPHGSLRITPEHDTSYTLACSGAGGTAISEAAHISVNIPSIPSLPLPLADPARNIPLADHQRPPAIKVLFDTNKAVIKPKYHKDLKNVGTFMKAQPTAKITIVGHTDNSGSKETNKNLSRRRAEKGRSYIIRKFGIDGSRIATKGLASRKPVASNKTRKGKALNRRIEVQ